MNELVKQLTQKTGIPEALARQAAEFVVKFLKDKLPAPIASQIDSAVQGGAKLDVAGVASKIGGVFGGK